MVGRRDAAPDIPNQILPEHLTEELSTPKNNTHFEAPIPSPPVTQVNESSSHRNSQEHPAFKMVAGVIAFCLLFLGLMSALGLSQLDQNVQKQASTGTNDTMCCLNDVE